MMASALFWGVGLGLVVAAFARRVAFDRDRSFYPTVMIVIATYYVLFAIMAGNDQAIWIEAGIAALFIAAAVAGYHLNPLIVAAAILAHAGYDTAHHLVFPDNGAPVWWPGFCGSIDGVLGVAAALAARVRTKQP